MKIIVINPNSSESMTQSIRDAAQSCVSETVSLDVHGRPEAPLSIERYSDGFKETSLLPPLVEELKTCGTAWHIIACFD